jgi:hypothetical protein
VVATTCRASGCKDGGGHRFPEIHVSTPALPPWGSGATVDKGVQR